MASKIPRLHTGAEYILGSATDDEKLRKFKGARPKQTTLKSITTKETDHTPETTKKKYFQKEPKYIKNKSSPYSGLTLKPKTTNEKAKMKFNIQKKKSIEKDVTDSKKVKENRDPCGSCKENTENQLLANDGKQKLRKKAEEIKTSIIQNKLRKSRGFDGLRITLKEHLSTEPSSELSKRKQRSKIDWDLKIGSPLEKEDHPLNETVIVNTNNSKAINEDSKLAEISPPLISETIQDEFAQKLLTSKKDNSHCGVKFAPKLKKKKPAFNFNFDSKISE